VKLQKDHQTLTRENRKLQNEVDRLSRAYADLSDEHALREKELEIAYAVQKGFLPQRSPLLARGQVAGRSVPARTVGGDFYTYRGFRPSDERLGIGIGDVSGKGVSAALLMSMTISTIDAFHLFRPQPIGSLFSQVNQALLEHLSADSDMFVTLFYAIFDFKQMRLTYGKAGHEPALLFRPDGVCETLTTEGTVLGKFEACPFEEKQIPLEPGMKILFYTDGVTETTNRSREEFGMDRLRQLVQRHPSDSPSAFIDRTFTEVERFRGTELQRDDLTMVVVDIKK